MKNLNLDDLNLEQAATMNILVHLGNEWDDAGVNMESDAVIDALTHCVELVRRAVGEEGRLIEPHFVHLYAIAIGRLLAENLIAELERGASEADLFSLASIGDLTALAIDASRCEDCGKLTVPSEWLGQLDQAGSHTH